MNRKKIARWELSAIYLVAALLASSVLALVGKAVTANLSRGEPPNWYPNLYVRTKAEFVIPEQRTVYLTFDDGPSENTEKVLDVLAENGVRATFFVTAQKADEAYTPKVLRRMLDEGHAIGLHTYTHEGHRLYRSLDNYMEDLNRLNEYLYETVGIRPNILRFAGGSATIMAEPYVMESIIEEVTSRGYQYYDWDVVSGDDTCTATSVETLVENMLYGVEVHAAQTEIVVLLHDNPSATTTPEAVGIVIEALREKGYSFDRLTGEVEPVHILSNRLRR